MQYLFETEHFLFRKRTPGDVCPQPGAFPGKNMRRLILKQDSGRTDMPDMLEIVFRATGAPAGEAAVKSLHGSQGTAEVLCCLRRDFQRNRFKKEIFQAITLFFS